MKPWPFKSNDPRVTPAPTPQPQESEPQMCECADCEFDLDEIVNNKCARCGEAVRP